MCFQRVQLSCWRTSYRFAIGCWYPAISRTWNFFSVHYDNTSPVLDVFSRCSVFWFLIIHFRNSLDELMCVFMVFNYLADTPHENVSGCWHQTNTPGTPNGNLLFFSKKFPLGIHGVFVWSQHPKHAFKCVNEIIEHPKTPLRLWWGVLGCSIDRHEFRRPDPSAGGGLPWQPIATVAIGNAASAWVADSWREGETERGLSAGRQGGLQLFPVLTNKVIMWVQHWFSKIEDKAQGFIGCS